MGGFIGRICAGNLPVTYCYKSGITIKTHFIMHMGLSLANKSEFKNSFNSALFLVGHGLTLSGVQ